MEFETEWNRGHCTEVKVIKWLRSIGLEVYDDVTIEEQYDDIDCYIKDQSKEWVPVSIKDESAGIPYKNIYFELMNLSRRTGKWEPSWYYTGKASYYVIVQGYIIRMLSKATVKKYVDHFNWDHVATLTKQRKRYQWNSGHNHIDTQCGYVNWNVIPHRVYNWDSETVKDYQVVGVDTCLN